MKEKIMEQIGTILEVEPTELRPEQTLEELEIDSILFIRLVVMCETSFQIQFEDEMLLLAKFDTIGDFVDYVQRRWEQKEDEAPAGEAR